MIIKIKIFNCNFFLVHSSAMDYIPYLPCYSNKLVEDVLPKFFKQWDLGALGSLIMQIFK